ncbi:MAG: hypothetical protein CVV42_08795 [Candidatus Riflebacteria bacterium HGW-Riflebacteria-2]|jgi:hypothetical protein|nr:MAG: hypothetical protein CVV42_08795 [Candidatus Riflebacteria bacterium HGW-Riflebacteria-2]
MSNASYLKMKTPADMLAVNFFATSGQLKGRFVQETDPPWTIWWEVPGEQGFISRIGNMIQGSLEAPDTIWEKGTPGSQLKSMQWLDLFRKAVIKKEESRQVADEVILMTDNKETFFGAVKKHFVLQQGQMEFASFEGRRDFHLLRITRPSLWVFNTLEESGFTWFNLVDNHSGIFVEAGWRIHDISGLDCFNQFRVVDNGVLLIQKDGRLVNLKPSWKKGESIIKVDFAELKVPQKSEDAAIKVKPFLRPTDRHHLAVFWKIQNHQQFKAIVANEALKSFRNYRSWFCADGRLFISARGAQADRALATVLSDAFVPFYEAEERVLLPIGKVLSPRLSSERLHAFFEASDKDILCIEEEDGELVCTLLGEADMLTIEDFIALEVERAAHRAETLKPAWKFEFKELKKKKQLIEIEVKAPVDMKLEAISEDGQVASGSVSMASGRLRESRINLEARQTSESETATLRLQVEEIDRQLNVNATDAALWRRRSEITTKLRMHVSTLAALLNSAVLSGNIDLMIDCALAYVKENPTLAALGQDRLSELEKGRLLQAIRDEAVTAEFHYLLLLVYGARFNDSDIFAQAVAGMKTGFASDRRQFYGFNELRVAHGGGMNVENRVELLTVDDLPRIKVNVKKFLQQVGCCPDIFSIALLKMQLVKMFSVHLNEEIAGALIGKVEFSFVRGWNESFTGSQFHKYFSDMVQSWPASVETAAADSQVGRWLRLLSMEKIRETPLRDFFTGELYRPPYLFSRQEESVLPSGVIKTAKWLGGLDTADFPETSDGKQIARAIYRRYSDGEKDWSDFFKAAMRSGDTLAISKTQRLLLLMVSEFGPHKPFAEFILSPRIDATQKQEWNIYTLTMYCDMFRLCLAYRIAVDEQKLFNYLINRIPQPPNGWQDFIDSAEWIIMCLLLTSSPVRRFQLDNLTGRAVRWLPHWVAKEDYQNYAQTLTVLSFLGIGVLADLVPEKLEIHQLLEKRRVFWIQHAFSLSTSGQKAFDSWQKACSN